MYIILSISYYFIVCCNIGHSTVQHHVLLCRLLPVAGPRSRPLGGDAAAPAQGPPGRSPPRGLYCTTI